MRIASAGERAGREPLLEVCSLDELHHEIGLAVLQAGVQEPDHVRMRQLRERLPLAAESHEVCFPGLFQREPLERDVAVERAVPDPEDGADPAAPDLGTQLEAAPQARGHRSFRPRHPRIIAVRRSAGP